MPPVDRFTVSLDTELLAAFDHYISRNGYENRSEAIRDMIRDLLLSSRPVPDAGTLAAVLTVACDSQAGETADHLRDCLLEHEEVVHGALHWPIDRRRDWLAIGLRGSAGRVQEVAGRVQAMRGIAHGHLSALPAQNHPVD